MTTTGLPRAVATAAALGCFLISLFFNNVCQVGKPSDSSCMMIWRQLDDVLSPPFAEKGVSIM